MTEVSAAGHIIGKGGANVKRIEQTHKVDIASRATGKDFKIIISGDKQNVQKAHDEIITSIRTNTAVPVPQTDKQAGKEASRKEVPTCKYFLKGGCSYGDKCRFKHPAAKRGRSPDRTARQSPSRKSRRTDRSSSKQPTGRFSVLR